MHEWIVFISSITIAIVTSHICSLLEAAILSLSPSQLATLRQHNPRNGRIVAALKRDINKPVAVILILNTAANTIGATIAGASLNQIFQGRYMGIFSILFVAIAIINDSIFVSLIETAVAQIVSISVIGWSPSA